MERYCECCDEWVKGKECPRCGAPTLAGEKMKRPITELVLAARVMHASAFDGAARDRLEKALESFAWVAEPKKKAS